MMDISAEELFARVEAYQAPSSQQPSLSLRETEPFLFAPIGENKGEIHGNDDYLIEELTADDLDIPLDVA